MAGESLGRAVLDLDVQMTPLIRGLAQGERRVAASVAVMQAMLDSLHADVNIRVSAAEAAAARIAGAGERVAATPVAAASAAAAAGAPPSERQAFYGVRGPERAGSVQNPVVMVLEASKFTPMGSYAAAIGQSSSTDTSRGGGPGAMATSADIASLTSSIADLAQQGSAPAQLATAGASGLAEPTARDRPVAVSLDDRTTRALRDTAAALQRLQFDTRSSQTRTVLTPVPARTGAPATADRTVLVPAAQRAAPAPQVTRDQTTIDRTTINQKASPAADAYQAALSRQASADTAARSAQASYTRSIAARSQASADERTAALAQQEAARQQASAAKAETKAAEAAMAAEAGAGGMGGPGGGGGGRLGVAVGGGSDGGSGRGGILSKVLWGGGALAAGGTIGSLAGLGPEHALMAALGVAGSAGTAAVGGGLLGLGTLGTMAVGGGADALVSKTASTNVKTFNSDINNLNQAIAVYGKNSRQARVAQAQLNYAFSEAGPAAKTEMGVAKQLQHLTNDVWPAVSAGAQVMSAHIMGQVLTLATQYAPLVAQAAQRNLTIINTGLHPLFAWLSGPTGVGIFHDLENQFAKNLPAGVHAFTQAVELILREMDIASRYTGGFIKTLDRLFTRWNAKPNSSLQDFTGRMIGDFRTWEALIKALGYDLYHLFKADAGSGKAIVEYLTDMLQKLGQWETSTRGQAQLHSIFSASKTEILALLSVIPPLVSMFGSFYLKVAPPLHLAVAGLVTVFVDLANAIAGISPGVATLLGLGLVAAKLGVLMPALKGAAGAMGLMTAAENANAGAAAGDAAATSDLTAAALANAAAARGATAEEIAAAAAAGREATAAKTGFMGLGSLKPSAIMSSLGSKGAALGGASQAEIAAGALTGRAALGAAALPALAAGGAGILGGSIIQHAAGLRGGTVGTIGGGVLGGVLGTLTPFGPFGTAAGAAIGATLGPSLEHLLGSVFGGGRSYGQKLADGLSKGFGGTAAPQLKAQLSKLGDQSQSALHAQHYVPYHGIGYKNLGPSAADIAKAKALARQAGQLVARQLEAGWSQYKYQSEPVMFTQFVAETKKLSPAAQAAALQSVIAFSKTLESQGRLTKGSTKQLIADVEEQFPGLVKYLGLQANTSAQTFTKALDFAKAEQNTKRSMNSIANDFSLVETAMQSTKGSTVAKAGAMVQALHSIQATGTGPMRRQATADLAALRGSFVTQFTAMGAVAASKMKDIESSVRSGSQGAAATAGRYWSQYVGIIKSAESAGVLTVQQGNKLIDQQLAKALQQLGVSSKDASKLAAQGWSVGQVASAIGGAKYLPPIIKATGGLVQVGAPGQAGRDTVPLNVGGTAIAVGPGEQVAVLNRHQQPIINDALARYGYDGLAGLFSRVTTPNYMATGGMVTPRALQGATPAGGGYRNPIGPGASPSRIDMGVDYGGSGVPLYALGAGTITNAGAGTGGWQPSWINLRLNDGRYAGAQIYYAEHVNSLVRANQQVQAGQRIATLNGGMEIGFATGSGNSTTSVGASEGFTGGNSTAAGVAMSNLIRSLGGPAGILEGAIAGKFNGASVAYGGAGGGGGPSWTDLVPPHVKGSGAIAQIAQAALDQVTKAANAYGQAHAPASSGGSVGIPSIASGPVSKEIFEAATKLGFNKVAIAGMIGNAVQESSLNPSLNVSGGRGLWSWNPGGNPQAAQVQLGNVAQQVALVVDSIGRGGVSALNATGSASAAATWFEGNFEHAGIPMMANRIAGAQAAFAAGYGQGGLVPGFATGGTPKAKGKKLSPAEQAFIASAKHKRPTKKGKPPRMAGGMAGGSFAGMPNPGRPAAGVPGFMGDTSALGLLGADRPLPFATADLGPLSQIVGQVLSLDAGDPQGISAGSGSSVVGDAKTMSDKIAWATNLWSSGLYPAPDFSSWNSPSSFVISQDAQGNPVTPYVSPSINQVVGQLGQMTGWQGQWVSDVKGALGISNALPRMIQKAIHRRTAMIAKIKKRIDANVKRIKALQAKIHQAQKRVRDWQQKIAAEKALKAPAHGAPYPHPKTKAQHAANAAAAHSQAARDQVFAAQRAAKIEGWTDDIASGQKHIKTWLADIVPLEAQNKQLGGNPYWVSTGGEIGQIMAQLGSPPSGGALAGISGGGASSSGLYQALDTVKGWSGTLGGTGGDLAQQQLQLKLYQQGLAGLVPGADAAQGAQAAQAAANAASNAAATPATPAGPTQLDQLTQQQNQLLAQELAVSQAQYGVLAKLPPFGGSFATGGIVPGPVGAASTIVAHGGETILPVGSQQPAQTPHVHVNFNGDTAWLKQFVNVEIKHSGRQVGRTVRRGLPGRGGGQLAPR